MEYDFSEPPEIGYSYKRASGQRYELIEIQPYVRRTDKADSFLLTWRSQCLTCGADFPVTAGMKTNGINRRCEAHKSPMQVARAVTGRNVSAVRVAKPAKIEEPWQLGPYAMHLTDGLLWGRFGHGTKEVTRFRYSPAKGLEVLSSEPDDKARIMPLVAALETKWQEFQEIGEADLLA